MDTKSSDFRFSSQNLSVVVLPTKQGFQAEWLYLFRDPGLGITELAPSLRVTLFDLISVASVSPDGLLCAPARRLLGNGISKSTRYGALQSLEQRHLVARSADGLIYVSPEIAYRGRASKWQAAWERWQALQKNAASGKAEDG